MNRDNKNIVNVPVIQRVVVPVTTLEQTIAVEHSRFLSFSPLSHNLGRNPLATHLNVVDA